jgi:hypothetical protein
MLVDTQKPYFKYSIKSRLVDRGTEVNTLHDHLLISGCDVTITTLSKYINQKYGSEKSIPSDILKEIASFLNVSMESLFNEWD